MHRRIQPLPELAPRSSLVRFALLSWSILSGDPYPSSTAGPWLCQAPQGGCTLNSPIFQMGKLRLGAGEFTCSKSKQTKQSLDVHSHLCNLRVWMLTLGGPALFAVSVCRLCFIVLSSPAVGRQGSPRVSEQQPQAWSLPEEPGWDSSQMDRNQRAGNQRGHHAGLSMRLSFPICEQKISLCAWALPSHRPQDEI